MSPFVLSSQPRLGLLGGLGARASARFHQMLLQERAKTALCRHDADFPWLLHLSAALRGFDETGVRDPQSVQASLEELVPLFRQAKLDRLAVVCNSLSPFKDFLEDALGVPVRFPGSASLAEVKARGWKRVVVLQSHSLAAAFGLEKEFAAEGIQVIHPCGVAQAQLTSLIGHLMADVDFDDRALAAQLNPLVARADGVLLGCTELTLWQPPAHWRAVDPLKRLSHQLLEELYPNEHS